MCIQISVNSVVFNFSSVNSVLFIFEKHSLVESSSLFLKIENRCFYRIRNKCESSKIFADNHNNNNNNNHKKTILCIVLTVNCDLSIAFIFYSVVIIFFVNIVKLHRDVFGIIPDYIDFLYLWRAIKIITAICIR